MEYLYHFVETIFGSSQKIDSVSVVFSKPQGYKNITSSQTNNSVKTNFMTSSVESLYET